MITTTMPSHAADTPERAATGKTSQRISTDDGRHNGRRTPRQMKEAAVTRTKSSKDVAGLKDYVGEHWFEDDGVSLLMAVTLGSNSAIVWAKGHLVRSIEP